MSIIYLRVVKVFNKTTGAFNSQSYVGNALRKEGIQSKSVLVFPIFEWVRHLLTFNLYTTESVHLIAVDFRNRQYHRVIRYINYLIFKYWLSKNLDLKTLILDGLLPVKKLVDEYQYISVVRSSPQCLVFSEMDGRRDHLLKYQLRQSKAIVCASPDAIDSWKAYGYLKNSKIIRLPVPLPTLLDKTIIKPESTIDDFLDQNDDILNIVIFGGNIGPRKGLIPLCDELSKLDKRKFKLMVFGAYDQNTHDLCRSYKFNIELLGFQKVDFLKPSKRNILRVYPALSECLSVVQLQGLLSGDRTMIYRRGMEPALNKWLGNNIVFDSFSEISNFIINNNYKFPPGEASKSFINDYKTMFETDLEHFVQYAKDT